LGARRRGFGIPPEADLGSHTRLILTAQEGSPLTSTARARSRARDRMSGDQTVPCV
jgi:hypothetical protein